MKLVHQSPRAVAPITVRLFPFPAKFLVGLDGRLSATSNKAVANLAPNVRDGAKSAKTAPFSVDDASRVGNWLAHIFQ